ncbi:MCM family protein [Dictyostelium purpureum]|uniref:DNA replication licensing factor MCM5 n=1 Tax=Dictyostelium purpureum TaxID=5786 RepID=F0ZGS3_DICPU|nr:MCM family protein [Dictyostelium purpureum]EGC36895.1 MCM family protein [Dictyostelium purpureum]|eukprot:XP_003286617.1 MCM family protein [Dictyostelium purpureum]
MSGFDEGNVMYSGGGGKSGLSKADEAKDGNTKELFKSFIKEWKNQENIFIYKEQLRQHYNLGWNYIEINIDHLVDFNQELGDRLVSSPNELILLFEDSVKDIIKEMNFNKESVEEDIQILFKNSANPEPIRNLKSGLISKLVKIQGIVISASRTQPKPSTMSIRCKNCEHQQTISVRPGIVSSVLPQQCEKGTNSAHKQCPNNPYVVLSDRSTFVNQQILKLQESPETIPTGEMPRHILLSLDRHLADKVTPGTRIKVLGVLGIFEGQGRRKEINGAGGTIRTNYLRVLGITSDNAGRDSMHFTPSEEQSFRNFSRHPNLRQVIANSIAPFIYGHEDIKRSISCQLFGGSAKCLPDKMRLRGDINILLLGDPGTAKSQLLKFVEKVAPISVYTSGKGSSAAGLTASVIREPSTGEYYLEGGAMVVADGGVVCIDEFDKMDLDDRVAIHEAMEQQTISIAKAGITTILNSRTSVLAAANPVYGRYNDMADDNIDFQSTILSRFDLIFIVKDPKNEKRDQIISKHVIGIHDRGHSSNSYLNNANGNNAGYSITNTVVDDSHISDNDVSVEYLKKYIAYCRSRISPRLSEEAAITLKNHYVSVRAKSKEQEETYGSNKEKKKKKNSIPITVRQLEAIIRISESLAKMSLSPVATIEHAKEAIRLFDISTFDAITTNNTVNETITPERLEMIQNVEKFLKNRIPIGMTARIKVLRAELARFEMDHFAIFKAIDILVARDEFEYRNQKRLLYRKI